MRESLLGSANESGTWFLCDDETVSEIKPNVNKKLMSNGDGLESSREAYMLVYMKTRQPVAAGEPPEELRVEVGADNAALEADRKQHADQ